MSTEGARSADQSVYENQRQLNVRKNALVWYCALGSCQGLCSIGILIPVIVSMYNNQGVAYMIACWSIFIWLILLSCIGCDVYMQGPEKDHRRMLYCYQIMTLLMIFISIPALIVICLCGYGSSNFDICSEYITRNYSNIPMTHILLGFGLAVIVTAVLGLTVHYRNRHAFGIHACLLFNIIDSHGHNIHLQQHHNNVRTVSSGHHVRTVSSGRHVSTVSSGHHVGTVSSGHQGITNSGFEPPPYSPPAIELRIAGVNNRLPLQQPNSIQTASSHVSDDPPKYSDIAFPSEPPPPYEEVNDIIY